MAGEDHEFRLHALEEDSKRNSKQHQDFYAAFRDLGERGARTDERYNNILATLGKLETSVEEIKGKPARRWDTVIVAVITAVVGFAVAWVLRL